MGYSSSESLTEFKDNGQHQLVADNYQMNSAPLGHSMASSLHSTGKVQSRNLKSIA